MSLIRLFVASVFLTEIAFAAEKYQEKELHMRTTAARQEAQKSVFLIMQRIGTNRAPAGTGYYVDHSNIVFGVTARHVVQELKAGPNGTTWGALYLERERRTKHRIKTNEIWGSSMLPGRWTNLIFFHPEREIDAAVFPIRREQEADEDLVSIPLSWVQPDKNVSVGEDVHILGFPGGFGFDEGKPVIRSGTIAYKLNSHTYLLDANLWQGDSGGLVMSKPYFGVPKETLGTYQWHIGGKILGIQSRYIKPEVFGLPPELTPYRVMVSSQAVLDIFKTPEMEKFLEAAAKATEKRVINEH